MLLNCGVGEDPWEPLGLQGYPTSPSWRKSVLNIHWKDWCWSWNSNTLATWCEELTHLKRPWCWERLKAGEQGDNRGWDDWMASPTQWIWVWVNSGSWWWTGRPGVPQFMGSRTVGHDWATEMNWNCSLIYQANISLQWSSAKKHLPVGGYKIGFPRSKWHLYSIKCLELLWCACKEDYRPQDLRCNT